MRGSGRHTGRLLALFLALPLLLADDSAAADTRACGAYSPAESAAVARRAWGEARTARGAKRYREAVDHAQRAHAAWLWYVTNSQWEEYGEDGTRRPGTSLRAPRLPRLEMQPAP